MTVGQIDFLNVFSSCTAEADESMVSESSCHIFTSLSSLQSIAFL